MKDVSLELLCLYLGICHYLYQYAIGNCLINSSAPFIQERYDKPAIEENVFEALEKDFQEVINELTGDQSLEKFRVEYEKLHAIMKKSYENEKRLMAKCRELNAEIVVNSAKVATALKLSQDDQTTIASLKRVNGHYTISA